MPYKKGVSGNPNGRPPKSRALTDLLVTELNKTMSLPNNKKLAGKRVLASLVIDALTKGQLKFPGDETSTIIGVHDWLEFVKWVYQYLEPPLTRVGLGDLEGERLKIEIEYVNKPYPTPGLTSGASKDLPKSE